MIADWECNGVFLADMLRDRHPVLFSELVSVLTSHNVDVRILNSVRDIWAKDYVPIQVNTSKFVQFRYEPDYLHDYPELRTGREVALQFHELGEFHHCEINLDGGNVVTSGKRAIVTDKIYSENRGWNRSNLRKELSRILEVEQLIVIKREPYDPIGHTDAMVRFINDDTVVVNDYTEVDPDFGDRLTKDLSHHGLKMKSLPYYLEPKSNNGIPSAVGCYTNFLLTEQVLIVPKYQHKSDTVALNKLKAVFPALSIVSLDCTNLAREGGVLNCISAGFRYRR